MPYTFVSLFAGVGGCDLGLEEAGWDCVAQVEWDNNCQQVLAHRWPSVPRWSDVRDVNGAELPAADMVTFGSPCQDLSMAGKRAGLDGARSGLFFEAVRIIKEMRDATNNRLPRWAVWENVAGAFSSNGGADFGAVLDALAECGAVDISWACLDAQWFGVPQRRRRVFVVACFDPAIAAVSPDPLLPVAPRSRWNPPARRAAWQASPRGAGASVAAGSGDRADDDLTAVAFSHTQGLDPQASFTAWPTLRAEGSGQAVGQVVIEPTDESQVAGFSIGSFATYSEGVGTLRARGGDIGGGSETLVTVFGQTQFAGYSEGVTTLTASSHKRPEDNIVVGAVVAVEPTVLAFEGYNQSVSEVYRPLRTGTDSGDSVLVDAIVRRLTPVECERLMGWPDDHTRWRADGTEQSDTARYKQCGNGIAAPVAAWVGKHIAAATALVYP